MSAFSFIKARAVLERTAIVKSHAAMPIKIATLYSQTVAISYSAIVFASTEPQMPSQNKMVNGLEIEIKNPMIVSVTRLTLRRDPFVPLFSPS